MTSVNVKEFATQLVDELFREVQERHDAEVAALEERLEEQRERQRQKDAEHQIELASRDRQHREQLAAVIGDSLIEGAQVEHLLIENNALRAENKALRARQEAADSERDRYARINEGLAEGKAAVERDLDAALWKIHQMGVSHAEDRRLVPERSVCPRCRGADTEYRKGDGYYCCRCEENYEPYPTRWA